MGLLAHFLCFKSTMEDDLVAFDVDHAVLRQAIAGGVNAMSVNLWYLEINKIPEGYEFIVEIDAENLTADLCAEVATHLKTVVGAEGLPKDIIYIDVSSPGINRKIHNIEQCQQYIGCLVRCSFADAGFLKGQIKEVTNNTITLELDHDTSFTINFDKIVQLNLQENLL